MGIVRRALLQRRNDGRIDPEVRSVAEEFSRRGMAVDYYIEKHLYRDRVPLHPETLLVGHIPNVIYALRRLGVVPPPPNDYPASLRPWLHRRVWESRVGDVVRRVHDDVGLPVFVKPARRLKRFTGGVIESWSDLRVMAGAADDTPVFCSEVVEWKVEFRVFVVRGQIVGKRPYTGTDSVTLDEQVVDEAVRTFEASDEAMAGYAIDLGVLADGRTALVEVNEGYGLGAYELPDDVYTDLLIARWVELTEPR